MQSHLQKKQVKEKKKRAIKRKKWLSLLPPTNGNTQRWLRENHYYGVYLWLLKHDKEWLSAHSPTPPKRREPRRKVNWEELDRLTAEEVRCAISRLRSRDGRPKRITAQAIVVAAEGKARLSKFHLGKLHVTAKLISEAIESRHQFAVRCLHWAAECFHQEGVAPTRSKLIACLGGEYNIWKEQPLNSIFESVWQYLQGAGSLLNVEAA
jgi:hypothetical protein